MEARAGMGRSPSLPAAIGGILFGGDRRSRSGEGGIRSAGGGGGAGTAGQAALAENQTTLVAFSIDFCDRQADRYWLEAELTFPAKSFRSLATWV